ncbi:predicted protein [Plenodomus lingam JN3]|uniref:Predicted protein n=1 Tax=Leptosphaeria maculans (strain JN3 / isolate v23.1.3 / race Av1-4-5-6-7-8) TaxID=985895 RepID=E5A0N8_LEPMJ|nr:predicted protein [Plenodomus lingam JN3]CBX97184.1 predicted protein [Plenodomus lingam JN3]
MSLLLYTASPKCCPGEMAEAELVAGDGWPGKHGVVYDVFLWEGKEFIIDDNIATATGRIECVDFSGQTWIQIASSIKVV